MSAKYLLGYLFGTNAFNAVINTIQDCIYNTAIHGLRPDHPKN
jgi:hypothetical protein